MKAFHLFFGFLFFCFKIDAQTLSNPPIATGISYELAQYRKSTISRIQYELQLSIPEAKTESIQGKEILSFNYKKHNRDPLQIDFKSQVSAIKSIRVNGTMAKPNITREHLLIENNSLRDGNNRIDLEFVAGDAALNRRDGYLYTLFVPDRARTMFPCFDQPNLKARLLLRLTLPKKWTAIANGKLADSVINKNSKTYLFANSDLLPTYLFSFAAGNFNSHIAAIDEQKSRLLYRETDTAKLNNSLDSIFAHYQTALRYYEKWTGIPYPFQKQGMVAIPDFQFGGMEHPGAILFQNASLFLDRNATQNQLNTRANLIGHEVAHMWFGDMVTMDWFNDVWTKEVFANFMADKSMNASADKETYNLKFLTTHFPAAYNVDRTLGANPIRQHLDNLQNAGMMYGPIIYDKAPIMMRQLESLMGEDNFQKGINEYLRKYTYKNATWPDLISILDNYTPEDLQSWNKTWVNETGRPVINYTVNYDNNKIEKLTIAQRPEYRNANKMWKQAFQVSLYYPDTTINILFNFSKAEQELSILRNYRKPLFLLMNSSGIGYGTFQIDTAVCHHFSLIKNPVARASAYISLYENVLNGSTMTPANLLHFFSDQLQNESNELDLRLITNYISSIYWGFISKEKRNLETVNLENTIWNALQKQTAKNNKKILLDCYQNIFQSQQAYDNLLRIWQQQTPPENIVLNDDDYTNIALALALRNNNNAELLQQQLTRIKNPDRTNRFKIIMQAASSNTEIRNNFFNGLSQQQNRSNESAVSAALSYLNHPLRQATSIAYLPKVLALLQEIQKTGDIFFPDNWLRASFGYYQDPRVLDLVNTFIADHPGYNPILKNKILQATDNLRRTQLLTVE
ncbi:MULTISPECIES: M1 family aminopeptidase [Chitinophagaceae]